MSRGGVCCEMYGIDLFTLQYIILFYNLIMTLSGLFLRTDNVMRFLQWRTLLSVLYSVIKPGRTWVWGVFCFLLLNCVFYTIYMVPKPVFYNCTLYFNSPWTLISSFYRCFRRFYLHQWHLMIFYFVGCVFTAAKFLYLFTTEKFIISRDFCTNVIFFSRGSNLV